MYAAVFLLAKLIDLYILLIFVWVLGGWFPQWRYQEWYQLVARAVEPYLNLFRGLRLQFGMLDLTPCAAMLILSLFQRLMYEAASGAF